MKETENFSKKGRSGMIVIMALFVCASICLGYPPKKNGEDKNEGSNSGGAGTKVQDESAQEDDEDYDGLLADEDRFMATDEGAEANDMMARQLLNDLIDGGGEYANEAKKILSAETK
jgi:hypothetical protein